ncbi:hypothetical protein LY90DRAFT_666410 [Neocallimastix californiae]|jgi:hypothetical protein|uniref:CCD97-like C-terminal domain-containing protein n=1 Tax=Neocallimastix californiae TaxID=1754190 RepID=A0A1Y2EQZ6_9FUNG|nr:hypothetical protein LY90DRAFT_666410 [Neocallimastix californiae]|eukprot:ORY73959.1 hypothetical protein LY90DRAFT_666410 [Neocallimastix californiae]
MTQIDDNNSPVNTIDDEIIDNLVKHILSLKVDLKSRRYDEEAQTDEVKEQWLKKTLKNDPALFLEKWGKHLKQSHLDFFDPLKDDYEIAYHLKTLRNSSNSQKLNNNMDSNINNKIIRNRRYNYVQQHPEYFTLEKLQERNPYEYEEYIGQYIPEDKRVEFQPFQNNMSLVERMYFDIDHQRMNDEIEEMEDILYQEEEKQKAEDKRDNELIKEKEEKEKEKEKDKRNNEEKLKSFEKGKDKDKDKVSKIISNTKKDTITNKDQEKIETKYETTTDSSMTNGNNNNNKNDNNDDDNDNNNFDNSNKNNQINNIDNQIEIEQPKYPIQVNEEDILKLSNKNQKFYQATNAMEEEDDFVEEEEDSDEEYNEETIQKEIERRRELKRQEQALKEEQKRKEAMAFSINNNSTTKGKRTKIRIINPTYYDNQQNQKKDQTKPIDTNNNSEAVSTSAKPEASTSLYQTKSQIKSVEDIFNVRDEDDHDHDHGRQQQIPKREEQYQQQNQSSNNNNKEEINEDEDEDEISEELKQYYYNEFINIMKKEFIDGNDKNFDYSMVDNCEDYDDIQMYEQDMHERYFEDQEEDLYDSYRRHHQNLQKRYYDERSLDTDMEDRLAEENYFDYD